MARDIPTAPTRPTRPSTPATGNSGGPTTKKKTTNTSSGGSGGDSIRAQENRMIARANAEKRKTGDRYMRQAANLESQARALREALDKSYRKALKQNLGDIDELVSSQLKMLLRGQKTRAEGYLDSAEDSAKAAAGASADASANLAREQRDALTEITLQGAGETDSMRAMLIGLRNWNANQGEVNRSLFDSQRAVQQSMADLNLDTQNAMATVTTQGNADRERIWQNFYDRRAETFTQLGNVRGQQADYYDMAAEMGVGVGKKKKAATTAMRSAFMAAAREAGKSWDNPGVPKWIQDYKGTTVPDAKVANTNLGASPRIQRAEAPEGAQLRKWEA